MNKLLVERSKLEGKVNVSGAKNSALKLITASLLTDEKVELLGFPSELLDVKIHLGMLEVLGKRYTVNGDNVKIEKENALDNAVLEWDKRSIRNTLLVLGALTTRYGFGKVPLPGGCKLGDRKFDLHVMILEKMGASVWEENGYLCAESKTRLQGSDILLPIRSTGATENAILCGVLAHGKTTVWNPHIRPEVLDLIALLNKMGAKIRVFGQKCIEIYGVDGLNGATHSVIPDNMEAITWAIASVITGGDIEIINFPYSDLEVPLAFLKESGMLYYKGDNSMIVRGGTAYPIEISTGPYPGINSDMQPLFAVYGATCRGESKIVDLRFPGRYGYVDELARMGLKYFVEGDMLKIQGGGTFCGTQVRALDLRAGMALVLAGLVADGTTEIDDFWQVERGYENIDLKLKKLNAKINHS